MRRINPAPVQQWVDSIPSHTKPVSSPNHQVLQEPVLSQNIDNTKKEGLKSSPVNRANMTVSVSVPNSPAIIMTGISSSSISNHKRLARGPSLQSDSSHCSSVESLLELRKADPEAILLGLGFGGSPNSPQESGPLSRIPKRFLQPSKLKGIDINEFVKHQQEASESLDSASLGYRGLTGSPYVAPSEIVQKIIERLHEHESHERDTHSACYENCGMQDGRLSVLSPDNRHFLEQPRSKSPDMRNKRMIIGEKSFAFGNDGDLIELDYSKPNSNIKNSIIVQHEDNQKNTDIVIHTLGPNCEKDESSMKQTEAELKKRLSPSELMKSKTNVEHAQTDNHQRFNEETEKSSSKLSITVISASLNEKTTSALQRSSGETDNMDESISNIRRSSEGAHSKSRLTNLTLEEGRRFSDGMLKNSRESLSSRRASFKRQARISEAEAVRYCNTESNE